MKLLELYEPLFQFLCRLKRASCISASPDYSRVRSDLVELLGQIERDAALDLRMANQVQRLELAILFFVDNLICTSRLPFAMKWFDHRLAVERGEQAGDERFFEFLEADLHDPSEEATERLAVYYVCLGLGFAGIYLGQPERVHAYVEAIVPRIRQWMDTDPKTRISEEAYRHTNRTALTEPPSKAIWLMTLAFMGVLLSGIFIYWYLYDQATSELNTVVKRLTSEDGMVSGTDR